MDYFKHREDATAEAARRISAALQRTLNTQGSATLAVSGGTTPEGVFQTLSGAALPWERVQVTLTDERCVHVSHPDSNEGLLRRTLLMAQAAQAHFLPLTQERLACAPDPFAAVLVGMGTDGHFASLFPDAANLKLGLALPAPLDVMDIRTQSSPHPRITLTLTRLLRTSCLLLLAFGDAKRARLEAPQGTPIAALLQQTQTPVQILWAP